MTKQHDPAYRLGVQCGRQAERAEVERAAHQIAEGASLEVMVALRRLLDRDDRTPVLELLDGGLS